MQYLTIVLKSLDMSMKAFLVFSDCRLTLYDSKRWLESSVKTYTERYHSPLHKQLGCPRLLSLLRIFNHHSLLGEL